jgi:DNA topoisomerase-1
VVSQAIGRVAERLGNTKSVCRKCYIHPAVIASYLETTLHDELHPKRKSKKRPQLPAHETAVLRLLELHQRRRGRAKVLLKVKTQKAG